MLFSVLILSISNKIWELHVNAEIFFQSKNYTYYHELTVVVE